MLGKQENLLPKWKNTIFESLFSCK